MKRLTQAEFEQLTGNSEVLARDTHGIKVLRREDGRIFKLFRQRRRLSSALWRPYALRFAANARALAKMGFETVTVDDAFRVPAMQRHVISYEELAGQTLSEALDAAENEAGDALLERVPAFIAEVHARGVFFRSMHFGNIVVRPTGTFGLIDVADLHLLRPPLSVSKRIRNFRHILRRPQDRAQVDAFGPDRFADLYLAAANLPDSAMTPIREAVSSS